MDVMEETDKGRKTRGRNMIDEKKRGRKYEEVKRFHRDRLRGGTKCGMMMIVFIC